MTLAALRSWIALLAGTVSLLPLVPSLANAQTAPASTEGTQVGEVIVTANKTEQRLRDVPLSVTSISGAQLEQRKLLSFEDYAALVPGLSIQTTGVGSTRVTLRGQNVGGAGSTVAIYIDDSPVGSSTALALGQTATADVDPFDLNRIEVLRGPQGTLYGANAEGGLIKFVTNAPSFNGVHGAGEIGGQFVDGGSSEGSARGWINVPLIDDKLAVRAGGFYEGLPGFVDNPLLGIKDVNSGERYGFRGSILAKPIDKLTLAVSGLYQKSIIDGTPQEDVVGAPNLPMVPPNQLDPAVGDLQQIRFKRDSQASRITNVAGKAAYDLGWATVTSITSYGEIDVRLGTDLTGSPVAPGFSYGDYAMLLFGQPGGLYITNNVRLTKFTEELRLNGAVGKLDWQAGYFYTHEKGTVTQDVSGFLFPSQADPGGPPLGGTALLSTYIEHAGFASGTYHVTPTIDLQAGLRYASNTQNATTAFLRGSLTGPGSESSYGSKGDVVTWSVSPSWRATPSTLLYARFASGYRPGGPNSPVPGAPPGAIKTSYDSDSTVSYEGGIKTQLFSNRVSVDLAGFYVDWSDIQLPQLSGPYSYTGNGGAAISQGVEATVEVRPTRGLDVIFAGAYTDAHLTKDAPLLGGFDGDRLPYVPDFSGSVDADYRWPLTSDLQAVVGGTVAYVGERYSVFSPDGSGFENHAKLPDYTTLALRAGVTFGNVSLLVYGRNLTDERGIQQFFSNGTANGHGIAVITQPRTFGVSLSSKF